MWWLLYRSGVCLPRLQIKDLFGKRVVITGEVGAGKTRLLSKLIDEAALAYDSKVAVLDLAPEVQINPNTTVGASVKTYCKHLNQVNYLRPKVIYAPRVQGRNKEEVLNLASKNASTIEPLLVSLTSTPPDILFIDDLTIYLQAGKIDLLTTLISKVRTFIATAYKGKVLLDDKGSGLSELEDNMLKYLLNDSKLNILEVPL